MSETKQVQRPPLSIIWIYALGQLGWSLASYSVFTLLNYFYLPPEAGETKAIFPNFIAQTTFLGLTLVGIISFGGRLLDAFIDPFVANISDKTFSKFGKRKLFMGLSALPLTLMSFLVFKPITEGVSFSNSVWLGFTTVIFYICFAFYVIPYNALISELGHVKEDRIKISTIISVTWALGFVLGTQTTAFKGVFEANGYSSLVAFQMTIGIFAVLSLIFMLIPVFFLNENKYALQGEPHTDFKTSIAAVFNNINYRYFGVMYLLYWLALTFIQAGIIYYVTVLLKLDENKAATFGVVSFLASFLFYPTMNYFEKRYGKKSTILTGFALFLIVFMVLLMPISGEIRFWTVSVLAAFPLAVFGILPNTIVADIVYENEKLTGKNQAGMYYAVTALMMKVGVSIANLIFPSLLVFGKSRENPLGVQLTIVAALVFCILGYLVFRKYKG